MNGDMINNDFLVELLSLQQDGKGAISAPSNWTKTEPLLEVATDVDPVVEQLSNSMLSNHGQNGVARWHFFIGSPGNGKSAAMGKLCRKLLDYYDCEICDEGGVSISNLDRNAMPYALEVREGSKRYLTGRIVQDASVVRDPFAGDVDPANELLNTLHDAWEGGISLVVCTNRGVLDKAFWDNHANRNINSEPWFKILKDVVHSDAISYGEIDGKRAFTAEKRQFSSVLVTYGHLDRRSLLLGVDTFRDIVKKAIHGGHWEVCDSCQVQEFCPFKTNRDWLNDSKAADNFFRILQRAEVFSGQVIVLREALALISLILAGCPRDYDGTHPCEWVRSRWHSGDVFALAVRRIYMTLYSASGSYGLEVDDEVRKLELEGLKTLLSITDTEDGLVRQALQSVVKGSSAPSTDVGVGRLIGFDGVMSRLDPTRESLAKDFYERWDADFGAMIQELPQSLSSLEEQCLKIWARLEENLERAEGYTVSKSYWALRRWASNFLLHLGAMVEGVTAFASELDEFGNLLQFMSQNSEPQTNDELIRIRDLNRSLHEVLRAVEEPNEPSSVRLSESVVLRGDWVTTELKPRIGSSNEPWGLSIAVKFKGDEETVLGAPMYLWLSRHASQGLSRWCLPHGLLTGVEDARARAAAKGRYAFQNDDVQLVIDDSSGGHFLIERVDGGVVVGHD